MTNIQTFIKEREERFDKRFEFGNENPALVGKGDAKSFHRQSLQDLLALIAEEVGNLKIPPMVVSVSTKEDIQKITYRGININHIEEYNKGISDAVSLLRSSLQVKE